MILVLGGAYNGKLSFVKEKFNINEEEVFTVDNDLNDINLDYSKKVINKFHNLIYKLSIKKIDAIEFIIKNKKFFEGKIIICDDISQGIVPLKIEERVWRENTGKCLQYISKNSKSVYRVFAGIPTVIKGE